jgi:hypothetical protein
MQMTEWIPPLNKTEETALHSIMHALDKLDDDSRRLVLTKLQDNASDTGERAYQPWPMFPPRS